VIAIPYVDIRRSNQSSAPAHVTRNP
jgi:hypothetical protein